MTPTHTGLSDRRVAGETDDRGVRVRSYLAELTAEADAKGGRDAVLEALRRTDDLASRYRAAVGHAARGILQYSGHGYPEAGVEPYGPAFEVAGVREDVYAWARRIIDELDLIAALRSVEEVLEAALAANEAGEEVYVLEYGDIVANVAGVNAEPIARALLEARREARR